MTRLQRIILALLAAGLAGRGRDGLARLARQLRRQRNDDLDLGPRRLTLERQWKPRLRDALQDVRKIRQARLSPPAAKKGQKA